MLIFFAIASAFNLCVGYVLGVYIGVFPGISRHVVLDDSSDGNWRSTPDDNHAFALGDPEPHDALMSSLEPDAADLSSALGEELAMPIDVDTKAIAEAAPDDLSELPRAANDLPESSNSPADEPSIEQLEESPQDELSESRDDARNESSDAPIVASDDVEALTEISMTS